MRTLQVPLHNIGGAQIHQTGKFIGLNRKICVHLERRGELVFTMIYEFNLALLAKQLWRLVQFPDSLMASGKILSPESVFANWCSV